MLRLVVFVIWVRVLVALVGMLAIAVWGVGRSDWDAVDSGWAVADYHRGVRALIGIDVVSLWVFVTLAGMFVIAVVDVGESGWGAVDSGWTVAD